MLSSKNIDILQHNIVILTTPSISKGALILFSVASVSPAAHSVASRLY
jgi:hypothetical protein